MLIQKINASVWLRWMKKTSSLIKDKRKDKAQRAYTCLNPKRHIPLVSLLLWHKMVTVRCVVWPLALQLWSGSDHETVKQNLRFGNFLKKTLYLATCKCFVIFNVVLCIIWTSTIP